MNCKEIMNRIKSIKSQKKIMKTCKEIISSIEKLKSALDDFKENLGATDKSNIADCVRESLTLKKLLLETQREIVSPDRIFLERLAKPEMIREMGSLNLHTNSEEGKFKNVLALFDDLPDYLVVDQEDYNRFLKEICKKNEIMDQYDEISRKYRSNIFNFIHTAFLNKFMRKDTVLSVDRVPDRLMQDGFGAYLTKGTIKMGTAGRGLGRGARNTTFIVADSATENLGEDAENCHFIVRDIVGNLENIGQDTRIDCQNFYGYLYKNKERITLSVQKVFEGGTNVFVQNISLFCDTNTGHVTNGFPSNTIVYNSAKNASVGNKPGVTFANRYDDGSFPYAKRAFCYDDASGKYLSIEEHQIEPKVVKNPKEVFEEIRALGQNGIGIIEDFSTFKEGQNPFILISNGILILKDLDDRFPIGEFMSGGAVIVDIPKLSPEEARKKISKNRRGGLILMRVPDPESAGKTNLIDLENPH